jgi:hypothetical protein
MPKKRKRGDETQITVKFGGNFNFNFCLIKKYFCIFKKKSHTHLMTKHWVLMLCFLHFMNITFVSTSHVK